MSNLPNLSFSEAAVRLSVICQRIDNAENIDELLQQEFSDALTGVTASVDRRKAFYREIESKIEMAKQFRDEVTKHIKKYENLKERLIERTKQTIAGNPDIVFKDSLGRQLKVIDNPSPKLIINENYQGPDTDDYLIMKQEISIDKDKVKEALLAGIELSFAHLEQGTQLRGIK